MLPLVQILADILANGSKEVGEKHDLTDAALSVRFHPLDRRCFPWCEFLLTEARVERERITALQ